MRFITSRRRNLLAAPQFEEGPAPAGNPGRGWYHIYTFGLGDGGAFVPPFCYEGETIALALFDIGFYRDKPLDGEALETVGKVFSFFTEKKMDLIVRVTYDTTGRGMEREPSSFSLIQQHMKQLAPLFLEYRDCILVHQGLFVGNWGEMHGSRFLTKEYLKRLTAVFQKETEGLVRLAFRRPVQYRQVVGRGVPGGKGLMGGRKSSDGKIGFYNDAMLASKSHMGTFGEGDCPDAGWEEPWSSGEEIKFMAPLLKEVPMGGEAVWAHRPLTAGETIRQLRELQVSYLNCVHDEKRLSQWKEIDWEGVSLYDYIGGRLGYCYTVRRCRLTDEGRKGFRLELEIENTGFACGYEPVSFLLYSGENARNPLPLNERGGTDLRDLSGGEKKMFVFSLENAFLEEGDELFLQIRRKKDGREILFANSYRGDKIFLGIIRKQGIIRK